MSELALGCGGIAAPDLGRVLVAVGAPEDRERMRRCLEACGLVADVAADGDTALSELRGGGFDLLLLDAALPVTDGFAMVDAVRRHPVTAPVQIVVIGGPDAERSVLHYLEMGADDVVWTPVAPASLRTRVAAALARAWLRERERECQEQVFRLVEAVAAEHGTVRLPGSDGLAGSDNPFAVLERVLARMAEEVRECEHLLRRGSDEPRTGA